MSRVLRVPPRGLCMLLAAVLGVLVCIMSLARHTVCHLSVDDLKAPVENLGHGLHGKVKRQKAAREGGTAKGRAWRSEAHRHGWCAPLLPPWSSEAAHESNDDDEYNYGNA
jgi:hypothetical protein